MKFKWQVGNLLINKEDKKLRGIILGFKRIKLFPSLAIIDEGYILNLSNWVKTSFDVLEIK